MRKVNCLRCNVEMRLLAREQIQLGEHTFLFGDLGNLLAGSLDADIYVCPVCEKYEFFKPSAGDMTEQELFVKCPGCGKTYSSYLAECPRCQTKKP